MTVELLTPAKINLGLEVIRRRDDGFHDIATVFQTISVFDRIRLEPAKLDDTRIINQLDQIESNLALRALELAKESGLTEQSYRIGITKRIPIAAGLGGASADAAAVLRGIQIDHDPGVDVLAELALRIGSDVPFLLRGGAAHATGRGEVLESLPSLRGCWIVLASPAIELERKTARLYGSLHPSDFSDGSRVLRTATALERGELPDRSDLGNAFSRALAEVLPLTTDLVADFAAAGTPFVALSGAGPTHYTIVGSLREAMEISARLARRTSIPTRVLVARPVRSGIQLRRNKTHATNFAL